MYFWLKLGHIAAMAVWFTGLFFLPRVFIARLQEAESASHEQLHVLGKTLYFGIMTPAGIATIVLGTMLLAYGFSGGWLPAKLSLVALGVLLHLYMGQLLFDLSHDHSRHGGMFYRALNWAPLLLLLGIAALAAAKPGAVPPLGGV
jgi:putative membrane protein